MARILLVDDDKDLLSLYGEVLQQAGHELTTTSDGDDAVELAKSFLPDLILMDIQMPGMDGIEATKRLKTSSMAKVPIVALTNMQLPREVDAALDAGCDGFIAKPMIPQDLLNELSLILNDL